MNVEKREQQLRGSVQMAVDANIFTVFTFLNRFSFVFTTLFTQTHKSIKEAGSDGWERLRWDWIWSVVRKVCSSFKGWLAFSQDRGQVLSQRSAKLSMTFVLWHQIFETVHYFITRSRHILEMTSIIWQMRMDYIKNRTLAAIYMSWAKPHNNTCHENISRAAKRVFNQL